MLRMPLWPAGATAGQPPKGGEGSYDRQMAVRNRKLERRPGAIKRARELRRSETNVEQRLWHALRDRGLLGAKFRRQVPIDRFVVDFACVEHKLVIELDGSQHAIQNEHDTFRDSVLGAKGFRVLRFWNNEVVENLEGVLESIRTALEG